MPKRAARIQDPRRGSPPPEAAGHAPDLAQTRAGRIRTLVQDVYTTHARRTVMVSEEDTSIDGAKVLLG